MDYGPWEASAWDAFQGPHTKYDPLAPWRISADDRGCLVFLAGLIRWHRVNNEPRRLIGWPRLCGYTPHLVLSHETGTMPDVP
jgi:hypothetical protein